MEGRDITMGEFIDETNKIEDSDMDECRDESQNTCLGDTSAGSENSIELPLYIGLEKSLENLFKEAKSVSKQWTDKKTKFDDRRSFSAFKWLLDIYGLDWHKYIVSGDYDLNVGHQLHELWDLFRMSPMKLIHDTNWLDATVYYNESLSLKEHLLGISGDEFKQDQAGLLVSFLDHLIMIQEEQQVVAQVMFLHLEQFRSCYAASLRAFSSKSFDGYRDWDECPFIGFNHSMNYYMCQQKHLFDSLHIMSRESAWWLRKFEDSHSSNDLLVQQFLGIIMLFLPKFKKSKELLDQYLLDRSCPFIEDKLRQLDIDNRAILDDFERHIKDLPKLLPGDDEESGDDEEPVTRKLLGCFAYAVDKGKTILDEATHLINDVVSGCSLKSAFDKCSSNTAHMINDVVSGIRFTENNLVKKGLPLGCIAYWRVLFETPLLNHTLDLLCERICQTTTLAIELINSDAGSEHSGVGSFFAWLRTAIDNLLLTAEKYLFDFVAMHKTVAEITFMLGEAFTTGGVGRDYHRILRRNINYFPWDDHEVRSELEIDLNDSRKEYWLDDNPDYSHGSESETDFT